MNKFKLLQILRESNTYQNLLIERFFTKYNYDNFRDDIKSEYLMEFLLEEGYLIKIAGADPFSVVDGPGLRYTLFLQGCSHNCKGCHNPQTHNYDEDGWFISIIELYNIILKHKDYIKGITLSGGDPLYEKNYLGVMNLCKLIKDNSDLNLDIWLYTGYDWSYVQSLDIIEYLDVVVDGRFIEELKSRDLKFKGSSNQRLINVRQSILKGEVVEWAEHI